MSRINRNAAADSFLRVIPSKSPTLKEASKAPTKPRRVDTFEVTTKGAVEIKPDSVKADGSIGARGSAEVGGAKVAGGIEVKGEIVGSERNDGKNTIWEIEATASVAVDGSVEGKVGGAKAKGGIKAKVEVKGRYEVRVPNEVRDQVKNPADLNPWNPDALPVGTVITADGSLSGEVAVEGGGSRKIGPVSAELKAKLGISATEEVAVVIEKTAPNKVKVTVGPKSSIDAEGRIGVSAEVPGLGKVGVEAGGEYHSSEQKTQEAEFDLSTPEGKAAYEHFLETGELPEHDGPGVSGCSTTSISKTSSEWEVSASALGEKLTLFGGDASSSTKSVTHSDGSKDVEVRVRRDSDDFTVVIKRSYKPDGTEDESKRQTTYETTVTKENEKEVEEMLTEAYGYPVDLQVGDTVSISLNAEQQAKLDAQLQKVKEKHWALAPIADSMRDEVEVPAGGDSTVDVPVLAIDPDTAEAVADITDEPLPGTITIRDAQGNEVKRPTPMQKMIEDLQRVADEAARIAQQQQQAS
ncbi:MAG: hypothetical protein QM817_20460 [Archangium sp.]